MPAMRSFTLENFRCFREKQTVCLAPLTLLVGENSTGKTSFLAFLRAMSEIASTGNTPNFKHPYDLGSFDEIAHHRGSRGSRADSFSGGLTATVSDFLLRDSTETRSQETFDLQVMFGKDPKGTAPTPIRQRIERGASWVEEVLDDGNYAYKAHVSTQRGEWKVVAPQGRNFPAELGAFLFYTQWIGRDGVFDDTDEQYPTLMPIGESPEFTKEDQDALSTLVEFGASNTPFQWPRFLFQRAESFASAPVRSQPHRTYDPGKWEREPEGDYVPMRMAELSSFQPELWETLKDRLEQFGRTSGLFDEIRVQHLGATGSDPFQLQVRKGSKSLKGPFRNIIDVGYGVNQALPIVTELLSPSEPTDLFLFQQPEVHLHPSAQAALGSLLCDIAAKPVQVIVETHSDHLIDRIRTDVRDGRTDLTVGQVRILYFERDGLDVNIHQIWWDENGNVINAPSSYRRFFMEEIERSLWLPK